MTRCPVCQRDTSSVNIGGQHYCADCGTVVSEQTPASTQAPRPISLDLSPRGRTNVIKRPEAPVRAQVSQEKDLVSVARPHGAAADTLHARVKPARVLDLRKAPKIPTEPPSVTHNVHHTPAAAPQATTVARHQAHFSDRFEQAKAVNRSPHIHKFSGQPLVGPGPAPAHQAPEHHPHDLSEEPLLELPKLAVTHHEAMTRLVPTPPAEPAARTATGTSWRPHLSLSPNNNRTAATITAIAIMGGYIWLQNYPKLALQSASSKAGLAASLPSYLPSSYSLSKTDTSPGLITLNFTSPSVSDKLQVAEHSTTWDSSSLLDNFVAKNTDDYSTVQGQGLTIYLFNNNQAAWVNHGIWYSIAGAGRLSREQILKIAYSL